MAQFWRDFSEYSLSADPRAVDWSARSTNSPIGLPDTSEVVAHAAGPAGRAWRFVNGTVNSGANLAYTLDDITGAPVEVEVYFEAVSFSGATDIYGMEVGGTAFVAGTDGDLDLYRSTHLRFNATNYRQQIAKLVSNSGTSLSITGSIANPPMDEVQSFLFQAIPESGSTRVRYKTWMRDTESEPVGWTATGLDSDLTSAGGDVGFWTRSINTTESFILCFGAGTAGDSAPREAPSGGTTYNQAVSGSLTPAGALSTRMIFAEQVAGSITIEGDILKLIRKGLSGSAAPSGSVLKKVSTTMAGSITPTGALSTLEAIQQAVSGSITATGALLKKVSFAISASITPSGAVTKKVSKTLQGSVTMTGALLKKAKVTLEGTVTAAGNVGVTWRQTVAGSITAAGALASQLIVGGVIKRSFIMLFRRRRGGP